MKSLSFIDSKYVNDTLLIMLPRFARLYDIILIPQQLIKLVSENCGSYHYYIILTIHFQFFFIPVSVMMNLSKLDTNDLVIMDIYILS